MKEGEVILELKKEALKELDQIDGFYLNKKAVRRLDEQSSMLSKQEMILPPLLFIGDYEQEMKKFAEVIGRILYLNDALDSRTVQYMKVEDLDWIIDFRSGIKDEDYDRAQFSSDVYDILAGQIVHPFGILYLEDSDEMMDIEFDLDRYPILSAIYGMAEQKADFLTIMAGKLEGMRELFLCADAFDLYDPDQRMWFDDFTRYRNG
ncbi:MAG: hypothetical protein IJL85_05235 [Erysipelotrichaceae bacterium]|nr:hypothetical protein [Erysipelotrichaceae bacterium]